MTGTARPTTSSRDDRTRGGATGRPVERRADLRRAAGICHFCGDELHPDEPARWRDVVDWTGYRPACGRCLCDQPGVCTGPACGCHRRRSAPVAPCDWCGRPAACTEPCPPRRGLWRARMAVCSIACLEAVRRAVPPPPPAPRPCEWCGDTFQPRTVRARFCGARCRQANHRHRAPFDLADALARLGVDLDHPGHPAQRWDREAFARALEQLHPDDLPLGSRSDRP